MNLHYVLATVKRVLDQLRHDPRSVVMTLLMPSALITLMYFLYDGNPIMIDRIGLIMIAVFPFSLMFLVTSVAMLRERTNGTLERLLTTPMNKADLLFGYGVAYSLVAALQAAITSIYATAVLGVTAKGGVILVIVAAMINAIPGVALGLLGSAFARTEFQAMQLLPVIVVPQILLCGLLVSRDNMAGWLGAISDVLPLTYAVDAMLKIGTHTNITNELVIDIGIVLGFGLVALALAATTLQRRSA